MDILSEFITVCHIESESKIYEKHFLFIVLLELVFYIVQEYDPIVILKLIHVFNKLSIGLIKFNPKFYFINMFLLMQLYSFYSYDTYFLTHNNTIFIIVLFFRKNEFYIIKTILLYFSTRLLCYTKNRNIHQFIIIMFMIITNVIDKYFEKN